MEHALEGISMGAAAAVTVMALGLLLILSRDCRRLLDATASCMQRNQVVAEAAYE